MASHATPPEPTRHHGTLNHLPPSPHEELENLGLVTSGESAHTSHHPDPGPGRDREAHPTNARSPEIRRPVA